MNAGVTNQERVDPRDVVVVILGGGRGRRLYPLTRDRAKPAVGFGGKYRLIDIVLTNCIRSRFEKVFILTQFNSFSLNRHVWQTYSREVRGEGFIEVLAAEQTEERRDWFQGTADAVRQSLRYIRRHGPRHVLILSADQIYGMDYREMLQWHRGHEAGITIAGLPVGPERIPTLGIIKVGGDMRVEAFCEKPADPARVADYRLSATAAGGCPPGSFLASMGIYLFDTDVLAAMLEGREPDFGKEVLPRAAGLHRMVCFPFQGYWEDVGTIRAFYEANMDWRRGRGIATLFHGGDSIITHARQLPPSRIEDTAISASVVADGCLLRASRIRDSIIGVRTRIGTGATVEESILMGNDDPEGPVPFEIGARCRIRRAIIDKNAVLGEGCTVTNAAGVDEADGKFYSIRSGIVVIPRGAVVPAGTTI